jgi:hypothetical protein
MSSEIQGTKDIRYTLYDNPDFTGNANAVCDYTITGTFNIDGGAINQPYTTIMAQNDHNHTYDTGSNITGFTITSVVPVCPCVNVIFQFITPTPSATPTITPTTTSLCDCVQFITVEVTNAGIITYLDCEGVEQFQNVAIGPEVIGIATCINKTTLGGTATFTIDSIGPCCTVVTPTPSATPTITPTNTQTSTPTETISVSPTSTATPTLTPSVVPLCIDVATNISLDITLNILEVDGSIASVSGGVWPNTPGNGASLYVNKPAGTYDVQIFYTCGVAGQHIEINSPLTGYACQNTTVGSGVVLFTGVGFSTLNCLQVLAADGTC